MSQPTHPGNLQCFLDEYRTQLKLAVESRPEDYAWPISDFDIVFERMSRAIERGSFNKDSEAIKKTCKSLGIKHTYSAIKEFISLQKGPRTMTQESLRRALFCKMLDLYYLDQRDLSHIARTLGVSSSTTNSWFNRWASGEIFTDIPKPKLDLEQANKIRKARYL